MVRADNQILLYQYFFLIQTDSARASFRQLILDPDASLYNFCDTKPNYMFFAPFLQFCNVEKNP